MAKQKRSTAANRSSYASASRFARDNRRTLGILGAAVAGSAALFFGRRYRDQQAAAEWSEDDVVGTPAI